MEFILIYTTLLTVFHKQVRLPYTWPLSLFPVDALFFSASDFLPISALAVPVVAALSGGVVARWRYYLFLFLNCFLLLSGFTSAGIWSPVVGQVLPLMLLSTSLLLPISGSVLLCARGFEVGFQLAYVAFLSCIIFSYLFAVDIGVTSEVSNRFQGPFGSPSVLAAFVMCGFFFVSPLFKILAFVILLFAGADGAIVVLCVLMVFTSFRNMVWLGVSIVMLLLSIPLVSQSNMEILEGIRPIMSVISKLGRLFGSGGGVDSIVGNRGAQYVVFLDALNTLHFYIGAYPLEEFNEIHRRLFGFAQSPHNTLMQVALIYHPILAIVLLIHVAIVYCCALRNKIFSPFAFGLVAIFTYGMAHNTLKQFPFWFFLVLSLMVIYDQSTRSRRRNEKTTAGPSPDFQ